MEVTPFLDRWGRRVSQHPKRWIHLGNLESFLLKDQLEEQEVHAPIFVSGMARSGSTILLEILHKHPQTASFSYEDFPFVHVPWFWSRVLHYGSSKVPAPVERAHQDRILITPKSPEAMEEMLWMHFFSDLHDPAVSHLKEGGECVEPFKTYYRKTVKKRLVASGKSRYLCKGNYHVSRLGMLQRVFPSARFVLPIRHPLSHIASSLKQHQLFLEAELRDPKILAHMKRVGHFEFGLERKAVNCGNPEDSLKIQQLWAEGKDIEGYALQWKVIHDHLAEQILREEVLCVRYEDLCGDSEQVLKELFVHCQLLGAEKVIQDYQKKLSLPRYYQQGFSPRERECIEEMTGQCAAKFGYTFEREQQDGR